MAGYVNLSGLCWLLRLMSYGQLIDILALT